MNKQENTPLPQWRFSTTLITLFARGPAIEELLLFFMLRHQL